MNFFSCFLSLSERSDRLSLVNLAAKEKHTANSAAWLAGSQ
jgi:hypothetical protein